MANLNEAKLPEIPDWVPTDVVFKGNNIRNFLISAKADTGKGGSICPYTFKTDFSAFLTTNVLPARPDILEAWFYLAILEGKESADITISYIKADSSGGSLAMDQKSLPNDIDEGKTVGAAPGMTLKFMELALINHRGAPTRFVQLVGCSQVKAMTEKNFVSFYASMSMDIDPTRIIPVVNFAAAIMPKIGAIVRSQYKTSSFIVYHTSGYSTPGLLKKMLDTFGSDLELIFKFSQGDHDSIQNAFDNPQDQTYADKLTGNVKVQLIAFLDAYGIFPDKYYWGVRTRDSIPVSLLAKRIKVIKRYAALKSGTEGLDQVNLNHLGNFV